MQDKFTMGSLFDGIGGFPLVARMNGIRPVWASEVEKVPIAITKRHFPKMQHLGDITKMSGRVAPPVSVITFGSPCQDLSVAGNRAGLEGERSGLFMEAVRIIKEMRDETNGQFPRFAVWENVAGAFSSNKGRDFGTVVSELGKIAGRSIPESEKRDGIVVWRPNGSVVGHGFSLAWRVMDAQFWGVPQRRRRVFLVVDFGGERAEEVLFEPDCLLGHSQEEREQGQGASQGSEGNAGKAVCFEPRSQDGIPRIHGDVAPTLNTAQGGQRQPCVALRNTAGTLRASAGAPKHESDWESLVLSFTPSGYGGYEEGVGTLRANGGDIGGGSETLVGFAKQSHSEYKASDKGNTLSTLHDFKNLASDGMIVRRLTPVECERLQGFPDNWTKHGHKGELVARYRKVGSEIPDSPRYKALGNSIAVPCAEYIFRNIAKILREE